MAGFLDPMAGFLDKPADLFLLTLLLLCGILVLLAIAHVDRPVLS